MGKAKRKVDEPRLLIWRRAADPFGDAKPLVDLAVLVGGLPDDRDPDEILRDLRRTRAIRHFDPQE